MLLKKKKHLTLKGAATLHGLKCKCQIGNKCPSIPLVIIEILQYRGKDPKLDMGLGTCLFYIVIITLFIFHFISSEYTILTNP